MCQLRFSESEPIRTLIRDHPSLLLTDMALAIYVMQEFAKGEESFFYPFLNIIPEPLNATDWSDNELLELQDSKLASRIMFRRDHLKSSYERTFKSLFEEYPGIISPDVYSWQLFKKSWGTIQARAFGRRLPWTSLVPFADCLNHANVQTKYDFNLNANNLFRLYPSGSNMYHAGSEVFNSYGRRTNENLLMEYGFAILHNEWDTVALTVHLSQEDPLYEEKRLIMLKLGTPSTRTFHLQGEKLLEDAIAFCRLISLDQEELQSIQNITYERIRSIRVSKRNEMAALYLLKEMVLFKNVDFQTSLQEDEATLAEATSKENQRQINALNYRMTKKAIIQKQTQLLESVIQLIQVVEWPIPESLQASIQGEKEDSILKYCNGLLAYFIHISQAVAC